MKSIYVGMVALVILVIAIFSSSPAGAYVNKTRSEALAYCESGIVWEQENMPGDWVFHGSCKDQPYDGDYPDYLGCYALWGNFDIPDEGVYGEDYEILDSCYGIDDDPAGKNVGPAGGCDGGEGGCPAGPADAGAPTAGDPVNTATGNKYVEEPDYTDDPWLTFRRFYNSDPAASSSAIGVRWSHSFNRRLDRTLLFNGASTITVYRPTGLRELFHKNGTAGWTASSDNPDILTESVDTEGNTTGYALWIAAIRHTETYATDGRLLSIKDNTGQIATLTYSDSSTPRAVAPQSNLLLSVTAPSGRTLSFIYDESSRIHQITLPDGNVLTYDYDHPGNLSVVTYPEGHQRQYVYNEQSLTGGTNLPAVMTGMIDENGVRLETTSYDENGRATSTESAGGAGRIAIRYNADGSSDVTYPLGGVSHQGYTKVLGLMRIANLDKPCGECGLRYGSRTYDANGYPATVTDFLGRVSNRTYDANGLLAQQVDGQGSSDQRTIDTTWNAALRVPLLRTVKDASGAVLRKEGWAYNASGQVTAQCLIDPIKAPSYTCAASGTAPAGVRRTVNTYCTTVSSTCPLLGLLLQVDGPRTDVTDTLNYAWYEQADESGCGTLGGPCHHVGDLKTVTDGAGLVTTYVSYDKAGRLTRQKAPNGVLTDYTYTPRGWLATTTVRAQASGAPSASDATTTVGYNPDGTVHQVTDPDGVVTTYTFDAAHRLTDITDGQGRRYHYTLDAAGNRTQEQVITAAGTVVRRTSQAFNALGQLTAITDGLNRTVFSATYADSYDADGNLIHSQDGLGLQRKQVFDGLNRLVSTLRNYQGTDNATKDAQSVISFDALDRITGFSDPDGLNTTYDIDALGNVPGLHSPDTGTTIRTFDVAGNPTTSTDAAGISSTSTFDANNRLLSTSYADTTLNVQYKYDEADTVTGCTGNLAKGHLTRIVEGNSGIVFCYDVHGNVVRKQQTVGTTPTTTTYAWTRGNRLNSVTTPSGTLITYTRDSIGNITSVTATPQGGPAATIVSNVVYRSFGPVASYKLGDGQTVTITHDVSGALTDISATAFSLHLNRDVLGNITSIGNTSGVPTATETYSYDPLYRLTGVKNPAGTAIEAYTYNKTGDRLSKTSPGILTGAYSYATGTHHLTGIGATTRQVDARGNTTASTLASGAYTFGYNQRNRLASVQKDDTTVGTYVLNALGQRIQKVAGGVATRFDYNESSQLLSESTGSSTRDYVWLGDLPVGIVDRAGTAATVAFIHADGLGTPRVVTNATGTMLWQWPYASNPFGETSPTSASGYVLNLRFPGQYFDAESGLNYNVNRDYEAASGRYLKSDPIGLRGGASTYVYAMSRPLTARDALGLAAGPPPMGPFPPDAPGRIPDASDIPDSIPGGPWTPAGPGQRAGDFWGPKQPGGRTMCRWVPSDTAGGPPGSQGYWKTQTPGVKGWSRYDQSGNPISPEEAHPGVGGRAPAPQEPVAPEPPAVTEPPVMEPVVEPLPEPPIFLEIP
ncbi:RHS repeat-associated core domain-containing protein [Luteibacter sp. UNCMF366Tsu5.1]|uniref:RHS repeat-associated core domain-containing protein n=1 Tax=Luteibacter sp. UNCMF366Tsu5.1 TaxID=1502758 RepID=UPI000908B724|nr:RHS repeat-associated core domain-containing protein [Luteibacter sp. UNCMF366Tsu5.1]SFW27696.1 RHS repeat-associated core domain-containing protein [Luteibacter sp. UNCMF366Tsu5.1]